MTRMKKKQLKKLYSTAIDFFYIHYRYSKKSQKKKRVLDFHTHLYGRGLFFYICRIRVEIYVAQLKQIPAIFRSQVCLTKQLTNRWTDGLSDMSKMVHM